MRWSGWYDRDLPQGYAHGVPVYTGGRQPGIIRTGEAEPDVAPYEAAATQPSLRARLGRGVLIALAWMLRGAGRLAARIDRALSRGANRLSPPR